MSSSSTSSPSSRVNKGESFNLNISNLWSCVSINYINYPSQIIQKRWTGKISCSFAYYGISTVYKQIIDSVHIVIVSLLVFYSILGLFCVIFLLIRFLFAFYRLLKDSKMPKTIKILALIWCLFRIKRLRMHNLNRYTSNQNKERKK